jgi:hypothetical protein
MAVTMNINYFSWEMTPCIVVDKYESSENPAAATFRMYEDGGRQFFSETPVFTHQSTRHYMTKDQWLVLFKESLPSQSMQRK